MAEKSQVAVLSHHGAVETAQGPPPPAFRRRGRPLLACDEGDRLLLRRPVMIPLSLPWRRALLALVLASASPAGLAAEGDDDPFAPDGLAVPMPVVPALSASTVVVFTGDELIRRGFRTLGEVLAFEAGFVRERAAGGQHYSLYGVDNGVSLTIDGVPLVVDGERDVLDVDDVLDLAEVDRVEIIKGPSTAFAGAGALTGSVRVTSKRPGTTGATVRASGTALLSSSSSGVLVGSPTAPISGERSIAATGSIRDGDVAARASVRLNSGAEQLWRLRAVPLRFERVAGVALPVTKGNADVVTGDDTTLNLRLAAVWGEAMVDVAIAHDLEQQPLSDFSHGLLDDPQSQTRDIVRSRALWQGVVAGVHTETAVTAGHHERGLRIPLFPRLGLFDDGGLLVVDSRADTLSALGRADVGLADGHRVLVAAFGDVTRATAVSSSTDPVTGEQTDDVVTFDDVSASVNGAVEYQGDFGGGLHLTAGVVAFWRTSFQPGLSPRAALSWHQGAFDVGASYSEGVRTPDRFDVTALAIAVVDGRVVGAAGNTALRPELVRTLQLTASWSPSQALSLSARAFGLRHEDAIASVVDGARLRPTNLAPRLLGGGELGAEVSPFVDVLHLRGGLVGVTPIAADPSADAGAALLQAVFDINATPTRALNLGVRGRAALKDPKDSAVVDVYAAAAVGSDVSDDLVVVFAIRNALDALELARDTQAPPFADPVLYPGAGRTLTLAIEGRF